MARPSRALALVLIVALGLAGCSGTPDGPSAPSDSVTATSAPVSVVATAVDIPRIAAHSTLIATGLNSDGTVEVPDVHRPGQASYYRLGPAPGNPGPALVLGHVNGDGQQGVFARLHELHAGDEVDIATAGAPVRFSVYKIELIDKCAKPAAGEHADANGCAPFPWSRILARTENTELRLVTCGGVLDRAHHNYLSNWVVYARKV